MMLTASMGMPKMNPPQMLATSMETSLVVGWIIHFMIGIVFALIYAYVISAWLTKISSTVLKGVVFGIIAFVIAQIGIQLMGAMLPNMPMPEGNMLILAMGSLIGHIVFGIVVSYFVKPNSAKQSS
jgi:uncharacterized membrane protein YagU involved in acid resistance